MKSPDAEDPRHRFGRTGELLAEQFLRAQGYRIVERNVKTPMGELDLVAEEGAVLVFVEVKARASEAFGGGLGAVNRRNGKNWCGWPPITWRSVAGGIGRAALTSW